MVLARHARGGNPFLSQVLRLFNHFTRSHRLRSKIIEYWRKTRIRGTMLSMQEKINTLDKPWAPIRKWGQKRECSVTLKLSHAEMNQIEQIAKRLDWTRVDVIRNCLANGTKDLDSFIDGCDSPLMEAAWLFMAGIGGLDETERVKAAMHAVRQTRNDERVARKQQELDPSWEVRTA